MFIKEVVIEGFRSYRHKTVVKDLSERHNVVVGRNGSGKSNFFYAVHFVLSDEFRRMSDEQRAQLLHEGSGMEPTVMKAYVQITFDNSDQRISFDGSSELVIRRDLMMKKDQYYVNKKSMSHEEVMGLLEMAGFARQNPYYIVKQGKVVQLATAPDSYRLKLLREVAGISLYDERKKESEHLLIETASKRAKIAETMEEIGERLTNLEGEMAELREFQKLDKERRCLEYAISDIELRDTKDKLKAIDDQLQRDTGARHGVTERQVQVADEIEILEVQVREVKNQIDQAGVETKQLRRQVEARVKERAKLSLQSEDIETAQQDDERRKEAAARDLEQIGDQITTAETSLRELLPDFTSVVEEEAQLLKRLEDCKERQSALYAKQGRHRQFRSQRERDSWIRKEVDELQHDMTGKQKEVCVLQRDVLQLNEKNGYLSEDLHERNDQLAEHRAAFAEMNKDRVSKKKQADTLAAERKKLWASERELEPKVQQLNEQIKTLQQQLRRTAPKAVFDGLDSVRRIAEEKRLAGVYGPLLEMFTCDERFEMAAEVAAGSSVFNAIVDSLETAQRVATVMTANSTHYPGQMTCLPLNNMRPKQYRYPDSDDARPLIEKLQFDHKLLGVMQHVFGNTLICRTLDVAVRVAKSGFNCVTLEGDQVSKHGGMSGGYHDKRQNRLRLQSNISAKQQELSDVEANLSEVKSQLNAIDTKMAKVLQELSGMETRQTRHKDEYEARKSEVRALTKEQAAVTHALTEKEKMLADVQSCIKANQSKIDSLLAEMNSDLQSQLAEDERQLLVSLEFEIEDCQSELKRCISTKAELGKRKQTFESLLEEDLNKRKEQLQQVLDDVSVEQQVRDVDLLRHENEQLESVIKDLKNRLADLRSSEENLTKKLADLLKSLEKKKQEESELETEIQDRQKLFDKKASKRAVLLTKEQEHVKKIRQLGSLPAEAFDKYVREPMRDLVRILQRTNSELRKYAHVNQRALDQFQTFSEEQEKLRERCAEMDQSLESINELLETLEHRKYEQVDFTFRQVAKYFEEVFKELVPEGSGRLVMRRRDPAAVMASQAESGILASSGILSQRSIPETELLSGVAIQVTFGESETMRDMQQLSGGQKSLVALTLVFAIQRCDPAPFYLFDEVDAALDPKHRSAVGTMIGRLSENAQFITTTFCPELLDSAHCFYGVSYANKISTIHPVEKEGAYDFVQEGMVPS